MGNIEQCGRIEWYDVVTGPEDARTKAVALEVKNTAVSSFFKKNRQKSNSPDNLDRLCLYQRS